jgi:methanol metabolism-related c-type cytochrome
MMRSELLGRALWLCLFVAAGFVCFDAGPAAAQEEEKPYSITDGKVDWYTYSGYRRYHGECHVCHGPDGLGSSFGPSLVNSLKTLSYDEFLEVVVNGRQNVSQATHRAMPAFGMNPNVMCFVDDIYAYLKARSDGALGRGRPEHEPKPDEARERDNACLGF